MGKSKKDRITMPPPTDINVKSARAKISTALIPPTTKMLESSRENLSLSALRLSNSSTKNPSQQNLVVSCSRTSAKSRPEDAALGRAHVTDTSGPHCYNNELRNPDFPVEASLNIDSEDPARKTFVDICNTVTAELKKLEVDPKYDNLPYTGLTMNVGKVPGVKRVTYFACGSFNRVYLVELKSSLNLRTLDLASIELAVVQKFILRLCREDVSEYLLPNQIHNDVALRRYILEKHPSIPVVRVYHYRATTERATSFTAEEYIDGKELSSIWPNMKPEQKKIVATQVAEIMVTLLSRSYDMIGGLCPISGKYAPTVQDCKSLDGRNDFYHDECYDIGPYHSCREWLLAYFDKEIYYYSNSTEKHWDGKTGMYDRNCVNQYVKLLKKDRRQLKKTPLREQHISLVHMDLHGGNILVKNDEVVAVLDWDMAGFYPQSEMFNHFVLDPRGSDPAIKRENTSYMNMVKTILRKRLFKEGWVTEKMDELMERSSDEIWEANRAFLSDLQIYYG